MNNEQRILFVLQEMHDLQDHLVKITVAGIPDVMTPTRAAEMRRLQDNIRAQIDHMYGRR